MSAVPDSRRRCRGMSQDDDCTLAGANSTPCSYSRSASSTYRVRPTLSLFSPRFPSLLSTLSFLSFFFSSLSCNYVSTYPWTNCNISRHNPRGPLLLSPFLPLLSQQDKRSTDYRFRLSQTLAYLCTQPRSLSTIIKIYIALASNKEDCYPQPLLAAPEGETLSHIMSGRSRRSKYWQPIP